MSTTPYDQLETPLLPGDEEYCPVGDPDGSKGDPAAHMHCICWWDGDGCCRCKAPGMTDEQKLEQGMEL